VYGVRRFNTTSNGYTNYFLEGFIIDGDIYTKQANVGPSLNMKELKLNGTNTNCVVETGKDLTHM
jgi:hypothetical protein